MYGPHHTWTCHALPVMEYRISDTVNFTRVNISGYIRVE